MSLLTKAGNLTITEEWCREFFLALQDMVLVTTPSGDLLEINQAAVEALGYSDKAEIAGFPLTNHYADPRDRSRLTALLRDRGSVKDYETRLVKKDGKEICVWITARARKDSTGRAICYEKIIKDVTHHKKRQDQLLEENRHFEKHYRDLKEERDQIEERADLLVKAIAEVDEAKQIIEEQNRKILAELEVAAKLQRSLLPKRYPHQKGFDFASKYVPSNRIGGDFFDIIELENGDIGVVIADVSGHGPAAALLTTMFKMSFQMYAREIVSPNQVLERLNREFCRLITTGEYITAFYFVLNTREGKLVYSKAGHPYPILYRRKTKTHDLLDAEGFFIGMFEEAIFENRETLLRSGDRLLLYTDGVIEARNPAGENFTRGHLEAILAEHEDLPCKAMIEMIYQKLWQFTRKDRFEDDLCMVFLSVGE